MPVGAFEDFPYVTETTMLPPQALLFLYTDGLSEAKNTNRKQFTLDRIAEVLQQCNDLQPAQVIERMQAEVHTFVGSAMQSDDLTMLAIRFTSLKS